MSVTPSITSIKSCELNADDVHELAFDLSGTLEQEADICAESEEGPIGAGNKRGAHNSGRVNKIGMCD